MLRPLQADAVPMLQAGTVCGMTKGPGRATLAPSLNRVGRTVNKRLPGPATMLIKLLLLTKHSATVVVVQQEMCT